MHLIFMAGALAAGLLTQQPHQHPPAAPAPQQKPAEPQQPHDHAAMTEGRGWHIMQDGVAFLTWNRQIAQPPADGFDRSDNEVVSQNWWMGMAGRPAGTGQLTLSLMLSLDPLTQYGDGYASLFQSGETYDGRAIIDRQHPHDFLMQAGVLWRVPVGRGYHLSLSGAPAGEPTLGPVAFMHRQSAAENLSAPLAHHTLDSTHIAHGVLAAGIDNGDWTFEASIFRGREPDSQRWDLIDVGPLDSWAARVWHRPSANLEVQVSFGMLNEPEELEVSDVRRTTASVSWTRPGDNWTAVTGAFGRNDKTEGSNTAWLGEFTQRAGRFAIFGRGEVLQVETDLLVNGVHGHTHDGEQLPRDWVTAITTGLTYDVATVRGFEIAAGADGTLFRPSDTLKSFYGRSPKSFHVFLRVRPPVSMGRMWNHVMTRPMH